MIERGVVEGNSFEPLIDGEAAFARVLAEIESARDEILVLQLYNKTRFIPDPNRERPATLDEALLAAARRGVRVRVLLNGNWLAPDDFRATRDWFAAHGAGLPIAVRRYALGPGVAHAKMLVADGERAILVDPPFEPRWWDTRAHPMRSIERGAGLPEHSVSAALRGPIVAEIANFFKRMWDSRAGWLTPDAPIATRATPPAHAGSERMRLRWTSPRGAIDDEGRSGILESYQEALTRARSWIYIENQYFTSRKARRAIRRALDRDPALTAILLLNERPDALLYPFWQDQRLRELGWPHDPRVGVFSLWRVEADEGDATAARPIYVHSKVAIADDAWATIGSANLDDLGLDSTGISALPDIRSVELNVELLDGLDGYPSRPRSVAALRRALWSEHLGIPEPDLRDAPPDGWLALWRAIAQRNVAALRAGAARIEGNLLPYHPPIPGHVRRLGSYAPAFARRSRTAA